MLALTVGGWDVLINCISVHLQFEYSLSVYLCCCGKCHHKLFKCFFNKISENGNYNRNIMGNNNNETKIETTTLNSEYTIIGLAPTHTDKDSTIYEETDSFVADSKYSV